MQDMISKLVCVVGLSGEMAGERVSAGADNRAESGAGTLFPHSQGKFPSQDRPLILGDLAVNSPVSENPYLMFQ